MTSLVNRIRQKSILALRQQLSNIQPSTQSINQIAVLACVSGGSDSVALLDILAHSKKLKPAFDLHVTHFDHKLRGAESQRDRDFVESLCKQYPQIDSVIIREWNNSSDACRSQKDARMWRESQIYDIASRDLKEYTTAVALAHHADDSVETLFMKLLRGTRLASLHGISSVVEKDHILKIRPLISFSKRELVEYLIDLEIPWVEDSSNMDTKYKRNKVRAELLPILQDLAGSPKALTERIEELSRQTRLLDSFVEFQLQHASAKEDDTGVFKLNPLEHEFLQRERLTRFLAKEIESTVLARSVEKAWCAINSSATIDVLVDLGGDFQAVCSHGVVKVRHRSES
mmetsp:Transcript_18137/g.27208  ORF Transcript_18137/g.27208 Transcript_18137/m.27208 type:complete len:344 (+) Transcript_18137:100-1131(+)